MEFSGWQEIVKLQTFILKIKRRKEGKRKSEISVFMGNKDQMHMIEELKEGVRNKPQQKMLYQSK